MPYRIQMGDDKILRVDFVGGVLEREEVDDFMRDFQGYLEAATPAAPLRTLTVAGQSGMKLSAKVRKAFSDLNGDPRIGKAATVGVDRYTRVLIGFVLKATGRDNIRLFDTEEQALAWLQE